MRVLIATDGSSCGSVAVNLVASMPWPKDTLMHVVTAIEPAHIDAAAAWMGVLATDPTEQDAYAVKTAREVVKRAAGALLGTGAEIDTAVLRDRPATSIVDEAFRWSADLIFVGSRGHGQIASMVLGSVSSEVVDHAPCPVLVARGDTAKHLMLATDGSPAARGAEEFLSSLAVAKQSIVDVVTVSGMKSQERETPADAAVLRLRATGVHADAIVTVGDPAEAILTLAKGRDVDLLVMGTRGLTGLERLRLGSVARNVLYHARCSVLVSRAVA